MIPITEKEKTQEENETMIYLGCVYPHELKGITEIKIHEDKRHLIVITDTPIKGHNKIRKMRINGTFNIEIFKSWIEGLRTYAKSYITDKVRELTSSTPRELRHLLATDQLIKTNSLKGVSNALGHKSKKNAMYYIDPLMMVEIMGIDKTISMINKTEHGYTLSLMRLAMRLELKQFFENIDA